MEKMLEVTPGTLDIESRPMRYQKELQLQLMCCAPFKILEWRLEVGGRIVDVLGVR